MGVKVNIPTRIGVDSDTLRRGDDTLDEALRRGLGRALAQSQDVVLAQAPTGAPVRAQPPEIIWTGNGVHQLDDDARAEAERRVRDVVDQTVADSGIQVTSPGAPPRHARHTRPPWFVQAALYFQVPVRDYLDYIEYVAPGDVDYHQLFLDVLPEQRWVTVWLVGVNITYRARDIFLEVLERMNELAPLGADEVPMWAATPRDADRDFLAWIDRSRRVERQIGSLQRHNVGRVRGDRLDAVFYPGAWILFTRMRLPAVPQINFPPGQEDATWETLRRTVMESPDAGQRADIIRTLIDLRHYQRAQAILHEALDINDFRQLAIRLQVLQALHDYADAPPYTVCRLLLYGLESDIDLVGYGYFVDWIKGPQWRPVLAVLERVLNEDERFYQLRAARVILHLLAWTQTEEAGRYRLQVRALRALAQRQNLWTGGVLGEESLRQLIRSQIDVLNEQIGAIDQRLEHSPVLDPLRDADRQLLRELRTELSTFSESLDELAVARLEETHSRMAGIVLGSATVFDRVGGLHDGIRRIRQFLQSDTAQSDEVTVLFNLRHRYIQALRDALSADDFALDLREIEMEGDNFAQTVAEFKWRRAQRDFREAVVNVYENDTLNQWQHRAGVRSESYHRMRRELRREMDSLEERFHPREVTTAGGTRIRVIGASGRDETMISHARSLNDAVDMETRVALFRIHMAMFGHVSVSLILESQIAEHHMGTTGFQTRTRARLQRIRQGIIDDWNENRLQAFIDRESEIADAFEDVQRDIRQAVRTDIAIDLLITAITALLTVGTGLIVRGALLGRTVGLIRTARAVETAVFLTDVGVFTAAELGSGHFVHGRPVTLESATEATIRNLTMLGGLRVLGRLTGPLLERGGYGFVAFHGITAGTLTGVSALITRVQTGHWPDDMGLFLTQSLGSYVVFMGVASAGRRALGTVADPVLEARIQRGVERLDASNASLLRRYEAAVRTSSLTEAEFNRIKQGLRDNIAQAQELAQQLRDAGIRTAEEYENLSRDLQALDAMIEAQEFRAPAGYLQLRGGARTVVALPGPEGLPGLVREGSTDLYRYNPAEMTREVRDALSRYEAAGYGVERLESGLIRVTRPDGNIAFILDPGPRLLPSGPQPRLLTSGTITRPQTTIERALGRGYLPDAELDAMQQQLRTINPRLLEVLEAEFTEPTVLSALRVFSLEFPQPWERWPIDSVRGVATLLQAERGVTLRSVLRLFETRSSSELSGLFRMYHAIADWPRADRLIAEDITPQTSIELIRIYDSLRRARIRLPDNMSNRALWGLLRWSREGRNIPVDLGRVALDQRLARLEADSPISDPRIRPTTRAERILRRHAREIRPGLDLAAGSISDVTTAVEAIGQAHGGSFSDAAVRTEFENLVRRYRTRISDFQAGQDVERILEGEREEIETVISALELGAEIFSLGNIRNIRITPNLYELPRGYHLINAPSDVVIQFDVGAQTVSGRLLLVETTTGGLSLPRALRGLDPMSGEPPNGTIDWNALDPDVASHRKWQQIIKMRAAAHFARALGESWGNATLELPDLVIRTSHVTEPARRALEAMDFRVIVTGSGNP